MQQSVTTSTAAEESGLSYRAAFESDLGTTPVLHYHSVVGDRAEGRAKGAELEEVK